MMIGTVDASPDLAAHLDARDPGQHEVEQDDVGLRRRRSMRQGLGAVAGDVDHEALALEARR